MHKAVNKKLIMLLNLTKNNLKQMQMRKDTYDWFLQSKAVYIKSQDRQTKIMLFWNMYILTETVKNEKFLRIIFIGVQLPHSVVLVSGVQQSESVIYIHIPAFFQILFPQRSLQSIEQSSLCFTVGPYQLSVLYIVVCIYASKPHEP